MLCVHQFDESPGQGLGSAFQRSTFLGSYSQMKFDVGSREPFGRIFAVCFQGCERHGPGTRRVLRFSQHRSEEVVEVLQEGGVSTIGCAQLVCLTSLVGDPLSFTAKNGHVSTSEAVDGLECVANKEELLVLSIEQTYDLALPMVGVLEFVYQESADFLLPSV